MMQSTSDIYTVILKRLMEFADPEKKRELAGIAIKEFIANHTDQESPESGFNMEQKPAGGKKKNTVYNK